MDIKQIRAKKSLKFITLLLTALMISGVSAATLYTMNINGTVTVSTAQVVWAKGTNTDVSVTLSGSTATVDLSVVNGTAQNFTDCLYLKNLATRQWSVNFTTTQALPTANFPTAKILIYNDTSGNYTYTGNFLDLTTLDASSTSNTLSANEIFSLVFEIVTTPSAAGAPSFSVKVAYK